MSSNVIFFAWNRSIPGRERISAQHFKDFVSFLESLVKNHGIQSFDPVFLNPHGGDMNGFFLIRGEPAKLKEILSSKEWVTHVFRANMHLQGLGVVRGQTGELIKERMELWTQCIPD
ncbi:MAG TPA: hypothetical protein DCY13_12150 [Verrucomicrobiales bacterium]|nr:hypothetical protein [Verrucomicrobiales bacterium]